MTEPRIEDVKDWLLIQAEGKAYFGKPAVHGPEDQIIADLTYLQDVAKDLDPVYDEYSKNLRAVASRLDVVCAKVVARIVLSPVYEYMLLMAQTPQGVVPMPQLRPVFGLMSVSRLEISGGIVVPVSAMTPDEQKAFGGMVGITLDALAQARAAAAGVQVAPTMPTGPVKFGNGPRLP